MRPRDLRRGFLLWDLLVGIGLSGLVLGAALSLNFFGRSQGDALGQRSRLLARARRVEAQLRQDLSRVVGASLQIDSEGRGFAALAKVALPGQGSLETREIQLEYDGSTPGDLWRSGDSLRLLSGPNERIEAEFEWAKPQRILRVSLRLSSERSRGPGSTLRTQWLFALPEEGDLVPLPEVAGAAESKLGAKRGPR